MPVTRYRPEQFADSGWDSGTPERKAKFINSLLRFVEAGFPQEGFTRQLYMGLSTHGYFDFIAHYDIRGFYAEQLSTPERQRRFVRDLVYSCKRDANLNRPDLWSDVKSVLAQHLSRPSTEAPPPRLQPFRAPSSRRVSGSNDAPTLF